MTANHVLEKPASRCYAQQWGFRCGSQIAELIGFIRDEYRAKYGCDYRLRRIGKNKFMAVPGEISDYGVAYAVEASKRFSTSVISDPRTGTHDIQLA